MQNTSHSVGATRDRRSICHCSTLHERSRAGDRIERASDDPATSFPRRVTSHEHNGLYCSAERMRGGGRRKEEAKSVGFSRKRQGDIISHTQSHNRKEVRRGARRKTTWEIRSYYATLRSPASQPNPFSPVRVLLSFFFLNGNVCETAMRFSIQMSPYC